MRHKAKPFDVPGLTRLERLRRFHGFTLLDMAAKTGISKSSLGRIANGLLPDVEAGMRIAKCFDMTVEQVWGDPVKPQTAIDGRSDLLSTHQSTHPPRTASLLDEAQQAVQRCGTSTAGAGRQVGQKTV